MEAVHSELDVSAYFGLTTKSKPYSVLEEYN